MPDRFNLCLIPEIRILAELARKVGSLFSGIQRPEKTTYEGARFSAHRFCPHTLRLKHEGPGPSHSYE